MNSAWLWLALISGLIMLIVVLALAFIGLLVIACAVATYRTRAAARTTPQ